MREELDQLRKQKAQCDVRNSRQRVAMARLVKRHELLLKERDNLKKENEELQKLVDEYEKENQEREEQETLDYLCKQEEAFNDYSFASEE